jgi:hypothetical protein
MPGKNKMPPELLAHFKKKGEEGNDGKNQDDKMRRKEAVKKARVRVEERSKESKRDQKEKAGKAGA